MDFQNISIQDSGFKNFQNPLFFISTRKALLNYESLIHRSMEYSRAASHLENIKNKLQTIFIIITHLFFSVSVWAWK